jgi:hypothetical protein
MLGLCGSEHAVMGDLKVRVEALLELPRLSRR